jgi:hypothetical protein
MIAEALLDVSKKVGLEVNVERSRQNYSLRKEPLGRPRRRWEDVRTDLREIEREVVE